MKAKNLNTKDSSKQEQNVDHNRMIEIWNNLTPVKEKKLFLKLK